MYRNHVLGGIVRLGQIQGINCGSSIQLERSVIKSGSYLYCLLRNGQLGIRTYAKAAKPTATSKYEAPLRKQEPAGKGVSYYMSILLGMSVVGGGLFYLQKYQQDVFLLDKYIPKNVQELNKSVKNVASNIPYLKDMEVFKQQEQQQPEPQKEEEILIIKEEKFPEEEEKGLPPAAEEVVVLQVDKQGGVDKVDITPIQEVFSELSAGDATSKEEVPQKEETPPTTQMAAEEQPPATEVQKKSDAEGEEFDVEVELEKVVGDPLGPLKEVQALHQASVESGSKELAAEAEQKIAPSQLPPIQIADESQLVSRALQQKDETKEEEEGWKLIQAVHKQARVDAEYFEGKMQELQKQHDTEILELKKQLQAEMERSNKLVQKEKNNNDLYRQILEKQRQVFVKAQEIAVKKASAQIALNYKEQAWRERGARLKDIDQFTDKLNTLELSFDRQKQLLQESKSSQDSFSSMVGMLDAMRTGKPLAQEINHLRNLAKNGKNELINCVVEMLPKRCTTEGIPTAQEITQKFKDLKFNLKALVYIPQGEGGMFSYWVARVAAGLKMEQPRGYVEGQEQGVGATLDGQLQRVEDCLNKSDLNGAAKILESAVQSSVAMKLCREWLQMVKDRATLEDGISILQTHATCMANML